jgi:hypothetical protein
MQRGSPAADRGPIRCVKIGVSYRTATDDPCPASAQSPTTSGQLAFHVRAGNYHTDSLIEVLGELRRFLGGEKATLLWDGLPSHRSAAMRA